MARATRTFSFKVDGDLERRIERLCSSRRMRKSDVIRAALRGLD